jgi:hypothetical protein
VFEHSNPVRKAPSRVVIIGAGGFVGGAIGERLAADKDPMLALTRNELDLLKPEASATLQRSLRADDSVVFVSALAPTRTNAMLIDNLRMAEAVCAALAAQPVGNAVKLPFPDNGFKAVISLNTVHNLERRECITAPREIERLAPGRAFVQVDSYRTAEQKALFEECVLTAKFHDYPDGWVALFKEAGYTGDYCCAIIE